MTTVYKYRVYCVTDSKNEYIWSTTKPTTCPTNTGHTIGEIAIVDKVSSNKVEIKEAVTETGGHYQVDFMELDIAASETKTTDYSNADNPINAYSVAFTTEESHRGDTLDVVISPDTTVGAITSAVSASDTVIDVEQSVIDNIKVGYRVKLDDGTNSDNCGVVKVVDSTNNQIIVSIAATQSFTVSSPVTYIKMTVPFTRNAIKFEAPMTFNFGSTKIGGSYVPAGTTVRTIYTNNSASAKKLIVYFETDY